MRRRIAALCILLALVAGLAYGLRSLAAWWEGLAQPSSSEGPKPGEAAPTTAALPFTPEFYLNGADLDGDGQVERVAVSRVENGLRQVALVTGAAGKERTLGQPIALPDALLEVQDLARAKGVLVWSGELPRRGEVTTLTVGGAEARLAAGGEPVRKGWQLDAAQGLVAVDYYALIAPATPPEPTVILVDKGLNVLWHYEEGQLVQTARVATGSHIDGPAPTLANQKENFITPVGQFAVSNMVPGMPFYRENIPALDPKNSLGTRWIGFNAFEGDKGAIWAIHGTNDPSRLGQWLSEGCIEMQNEAVEALYARVKVGTPLVIQNSLQSGGGV